MVVLDFMIVSVALPSIQRDLHVATTTLLWLVRAYAVAAGRPSRRRLRQGQAVPDRLGGVVAAGISGVWPSGRAC